MKLIRIPLTKCDLLLYENEILQNLPNNVIIEGIKRGKYWKRTQQAVKREPRIPGERK